MLQDARVMRVIKTAGFAVGIFACFALVGNSAFAHPHVWVSVNATIVYENGSITGVRHSWTFDETYAQMAIEGLDKNNDGKYDRNELAELTKVNMEGLKEFDYFTFAKLGSQMLKTRDPSDAWLEYNANILTLHFTLPLEQPVLAEAEGFTLQVYDPSFFIAFELAGKDPIKFNEHAPHACKVSIEVPKEDADQAKQLGQAFSEQLGDGAVDLGAGMVKTISVSCAKS